MPIRTNRGRAAVYRKVWGWPLRSPRHLVGAILVVVAVAVAVGITIARSQGDSGPGGDRAKQGPPSAPSVTVTEPNRQGSAVPNRLTEEPHPSSAPVAPEALTAAEQWTKAWSHHPRGTSNEQWREGLRPYTTPDFLPELRSVDPANVPASKVTGKPKPVESYQASLTARVPTDGGAVQVTVVKTGQGWRVSTYGKG